MYPQSFFSKCLCIKNWNFDLDSRALSINAYKALYMFTVWLIQLNIDNFINEMRKYFIKYQLAGIFEWIHKIVL